MIILENCASINESNSEDLQFLEKERLRAKEKYLDNIVLCLNDALYYGQDNQIDKWQADVLKFSVKLIDNKLFDDKYWKDRLDIKINAYQ